MAGARIPGPIGSPGRPQENINDGTNARTVSALPGPIGMRLPEPSFVDRIEALLRDRDPQWFIVRVLGPQCYSAGMIVGLGTGAVGAVVDTAELIRVVVLAEIADGIYPRSTFARMASWTRLPNVAMQIVGLPAAIEHRLREAQDERDALVEAVKYAFSNPGEVFDQIKDEYVKKYERYQSLMATESLGARYEAGKHFGELLFVLLGVLATGVGLAKLVAKVPKLARLGARLAGRRGAGAAARPGVVPKGPRGGEAMPPSEVQSPRRQNAPTAPISDATIDQIVSTPKGSRPDPSSYLSKDYVDAHLEQFNSGGTKIMAKPPTGTVGPPGGTFVLPKTLADDMIARSGGDVRRLETMLGLDPGALGSSPVRVDVPAPSGLRVPSGNELGANSYWKPGGVTSGGIPEATIDPTPLGSYSVAPVFSPKVP